MNRFLSLFACVLVLAAGLSPVALAGTPLLISHQGRLLDGDDQPVSGNVVITFKIYDSSSDGVLLWSEPHPSVVVSDGLFSVTLGSMTPITPDLFAPPSSGSPGVAPERYLEVKVGNDVPLTPRVRLVSVPFATVAHRLSGDIETGPGGMQMGDATVPSNGTIRWHVGGSDLSAMERDTDLDGDVDHSMVDSVDATGGESVISSTEGDGDVNIVGMSTNKAYPRTEVVKKIWATGHKDGVVLSAQDSPDGVVGEMAIEVGGHRRVSVNGSGAGSSVGIEAGVAIPKFIHLTSDDSKSSARLGLGLATTGEWSSSETGVLHRLSWDADNDGTRDSEVKGSCDDSGGSIGIVAGVAIPKFINLTSDASKSSARLGLGLSTTGEWSSSESGVLHRLSWDADNDGTRDSEVKGSCDDSGGSIGIVAGVAIPKFINLTSDASKSSARLGLGLSTTGEWSASETETRLSVTPASAGTYQFELTCTESSGGLGGHSSMRFIGPSDDTTVSIHGDGRVGIGVSDPIHPLEHSSGAHLTAGGVWTNASDARLKENFSEIEADALLARLEQLPIRKWNYKNEDESVTHIGPTAQDFREAFGLGSNDKTISTIDPSGIALVAIQEVLKQNRELASQNERLQEKLEKLSRQVEALVATR